MTYEEWKHAREPKKPEPEITTRQEANKTLKDMFIEMDSTKKSSDVMLIDTATQLRALENKFGIVDDLVAHLTVMRGSESNNTAGAGGWVTIAGRFKADGKGMQLNFNPTYFGDEKFMVEKIKARISEGKLMECSEEFYTKYVVTHEYGHMLEYSEIAHRLKAKGLPINDANIKQQTYSILDEIISYAKDIDENYEFPDGLSLIGKSEPVEAFAEIFAGSQLGKPNTLGKAMTEWLRRH